MVHKHEFSIHKKGEKTMDYTTNQKQFDNEMKALSIGVYKGQEKYIPKDWIMISESDNKSGFHGKAFFKNGTIVIAMRGTDDEDDLANDIDMVKKATCTYTLVTVWKLWFLTIKYKSIAAFSSKDGYSSTPSKVW